MKNVFNLSGNDIYIDIDSITMLTRIRHSQGRVGFMSDLSRDFQDSMERQGEHNDQIGRIVAASVIERMVNSVHGAGLWVVTPDGSMYSCDKKGVS